MKLKHELKAFRADDLYFVRVEDAVKVGRSWHPEARLSQIQCHNHHRIESITILSQLGYQEKAWHAALLEHHRHGEWFDWSPAIGKAIGLAKRGRVWWRHLPAPYEFIADWVDPEADEEDEIQEAYAEWDMLMSLYTDPDNAKYQGKPARPLPRLISDRSGSLEFEVVQLG